MYIINTNFLYRISDNMEIYEQSLQQTKRIPHCAVKFEAGEETRIVHESLHCFPIFVGLVQTSFPWRYSSFYTKIWQTAPNFAESYLWCTIKTYEVFARSRLIKFIFHYVLFTSNILEFNLIHLIPKLAMLTLSVHYEPFNINYA